MMNASQIYTNDTLATSRKPAAKTALKKITPPRLSEKATFLTSHRGLSHYRDPI